MSHDGPLVVGVDVGSQGTCAQALEPDGTLVATTSEPHALSYPRPGWAEQDPGEWTNALVATLSRIREATAGREIVALSFGSQLDGLVAAGADGTPLHPALVWSDRRAGAECEAAAERTEPDTLRALTGCNLDPGHVAPKIAWLARRLDVPRGTLLLTIEQVDRTVDGVPVLVSREHHVADAFTFTLLRRGPGEGES